MQLLVQSALSGLGMIDIFVSGIRDQFREKYFAMEK